ncbi:ABC transporter substrate-binding protein [Arthrobacter glacialis]|uniref:ABC transporter substrate-binding protein n=1 Tax=Arthrobacter glacialis TaxID=1664 RepID=A0A2S3ZV35_ARTGL|nr:ABC transporter substrate-binding protein [Arthrobacter glacialis]POH73125.1 ABC transporter substrate-binding protein [Arthrobacter glacialis]
MMLNRYRRMAQAAALLSVFSLALTACGGGSQAGAAPSEAAPTTQALAADADQSANGNMVFCGGKDTGIQTNLVKNFNESQSAVKASYVELGPDTSATRTAAIQRLEGGNKDCDIYMTDVTWTAEWASQGWLYDQTGLVKNIGTEIMPSVLDTTVYDNKNWSTPFYTNAALVLYRKDRVQAPATWKELYKQAAKSEDNKLLIQLKPYEGLTVNFLELLYSAGGDAIDQDGKVVIDSPQTREVLQFMRDGLANGSIDRASLTYDETATRRAFESGVGGFQRNWPNSYASAQETNVGPETAVSPLPAFDDTNEPSGVLGGWNLAVPITAKNPGGAAAFIKYTVSRDQQKTMFLTNSQAPVIADIYSDPDVVKALPFSGELKQTLENAKPRPKSPAYAQISQAIYDNVYAVLSTSVSIDDAVKKMVSEMEKAQETF